MKLAISVQEMAEVKLTEDGRKIWLAYQCRAFENAAAITGGSDIVRAPLWELMEVFGPLLRARPPSPRKPLFEYDEIRLLLPMR